VTLVGNSTPLTAGEAGKLQVSAVQLAELSGLQATDIHYWAREGYIKRSMNGSKRPFSLEHLPKVKLMRKMTKDYRLSAAKASALADELLAMHSAEPDAYQAAILLLEEFDKSITILARAAVKAGLPDVLAEARAKRPEGTEDP